MVGPSPLFDWLVDGAPGATTAVDVIERMGNELVAAGIGTHRIGVFVKTLHPTVLGRAFWWEHGGTVRVLDMTLEMQDSPTVQRSPVATVSTTRKEYRRYLVDPLDEADFAVLHELRSAGFTDFIAFPVGFLRGETHAITFATRTIGGFKDEDLAELRNVMRPLARVTEIFALHRTAANLLNTYVGRNSGERILAGRIFKGDIETIRSVIWFSDLRGFTEMSSKLTPREIIDALNELFECQVPSIEKHGGEVLKFIGDGLLAIFPIANENIAAACDAALLASDEAFAALAKRNEGAARALSFGLALHTGEIAYGNIGGASRLDFTVIGPAVNVAARLEGLTGKLGKRVVVSSEFASHASTSREFEDLGAFELKGVPNAQHVLAPT